MLLITVIFILVYIMKIIFDIPYIINKEYFTLKAILLNKVMVVRMFRMNVEAFL